MATFYDQLVETRERYGGRPALVHNGRSQTWDALAAEVDRVAAGLIAKGVGRGDKIALWLSNVPEWATVWFAAASIGAAVVPLNTRYKVDEVAYVLRQSALPSTACPAISS